MVTTPLTDTVRTTSTTRRDVTHPMQPTLRSRVDLHVQREPTTANAPRSNRRFTWRGVLRSGQGRWGPVAPPLRRDHAVLPGRARRRCALRRLLQRAPGRPADRG